MTGILALLERSIRHDVRSLLSHSARAVLILSVYLMVVSIVQMLRFGPGAPGLFMFQFIAYLDIVFLTLFGVAFIATSVTEEKEDENLELMLMAEIHPVSILVGKSCDRLLQAFIFIACQFPLTLFAITLGGVTMRQIFAVYFCLFAYVTMLAGLGVFCSTI